MYLIREYCKDFEFGFRTIVLLGFVVFGMGAAVTATLGLVVFAILELVFDTQLTGNQWFYFFVAACICAGIPKVRSAIDIVMQQERQEQIEKANQLSAAAEMLRGASKGNKLNSNQQVTPTTAADAAYNSARRDPVSGRPLID